MYHKKLLIGIKGSVSLGGIDRYLSLLQAYITGSQLEIYLLYSKCVMNYMMMPYLLYTFNDNALLQEMFCYEMTIRENHVYRNGFV